MSIASPVVPSASPSSALDDAISRAKNHLLDLQHHTGYWCGELQGDSILESEYILLKWILGQESDPDLPLIANYLRNLQNEFGGWSLFPGGPSDLSGTAKAYFALKLMGDDPSAPHMIRAKQETLRLGGAEKCNSFSKFYLACLGQVPWDSNPNIPPEIVFLPKWFYFNLYHVSAWTRTMILPLAIVTTHRPVRKIPEHLGIPEIFHDQNWRMKPADGLPTSWRDFFLHVDNFLKWYNARPIKWLREKAIRASEQWMLARMEGSEGLGAIFPPMVYMLIVFRILGYSDDHPIVVKAHKDLKDFYIREENSIRLQPCVSPIWDTSIAMHALAFAGLTPADEPSQRATNWLLKKECRWPSDWCINCPGVEPSGWYFEFLNPHYPDVDDTVMVIQALSRLGGDPAKPAINRGLNWTMAMQNSDGGWAAFDRTKSRPILEAVPFADHNAMQDPSCPDITGRVLEALGHCGLTVANPAVKKAVDYIKSQQDPDGPWWGRWGVNYVYGSFLVLVGFEKVGHDMSDPAVQRCVAWLKRVQKPDGSWGESAYTYEHPETKGQGPSTASQTAWGCLALMAAVGAEDPAVKRGINWLIEHQREDGNYDEPWFTGTGFPKVFYLKYHLYRLYFPLMAMARYRGLIHCGDAEKCLMSNSF